MRLARQSDIVAFFATTHHHRIPSISLTTSATASISSSSSSLSFFTHNHKQYHHHHHHHHPHNNIIYRQFHSSSINYLWTLRTNSCLFSTSSSSKESQTPPQKEKEESTNEETTTTTTNTTSTSSSTTTTTNTFASSYHTPVMVHECINALLQCQRSTTTTTKTTTTKNQNGLIFIDGTLGGGGHSEALLSKLGSNDIVIGCDVDSDALTEASNRLKRFMRMDDDNDNDRAMFVPIRCNFRDLDTMLMDVKHPMTGHHLFQNDNDDDNDGVKVDGLLLDLGVSSHQIDNGERGFAYMKDGPLDMRMSPPSSPSSSSSQDDDNDDVYVDGGITAADICNQFSEDDLAQILRKYGDEPKYRKVARSIIDRRPLVLTSDLYQAVADVTPEYTRKKKKKKQHGSGGGGGGGSRRMGRMATLSRVFQALRIVVNEEERALHEVLLDVAPEVVREGGMLVVLSYHSMEDRAVKRVLRDGRLDIGDDGKMRKNSYYEVERDLYGNRLGPEVPWEVVGKRRKAGEEEVEQNLRARSAILRVGRRVKSVSRHGDDDDEEEGW